MEKAIVVNNLVKKYKKAEKNAVDGISFYVDEGSFFAFLGPNGAGKTTTISILTTTLSKTSGTVSISGFDLDKQQKEVRENIGVIFQKPSLDLNLTAEENVRMHAIMYGLYPFRPTYSLMPQQYKDRILELAKILEIQNDLFKPIKTLSGGMKRKLEIIRTLLHKPKVLFLDEPTSGLDPASRKALWTYLQRVREQEKTTIFLTTHYLDEAEDADYLCVINNGKIISKGSPDHVKEELIDEYMTADIDPKDKDQLKSELDSQNLTYKFYDHKIEINLKDQSVQKIIKDVDVRLANIKIVRPSLEEAYIKIIDEHKNDI